MKGLNYPFEKIHQPFERLKQSVGEIHQLFERLELSVQERNSKLFWQPFQQYKTRQDFKTIHQALLNDTCRHVYIMQKVVTLLFFVYLRLKTFDSQAPIISKALWSLRVRGGFRRHALLPCERD